MRTIQTADAFPVLNADAVLCDMATEDLPPSEYFFRQLQFLCNPALWPETWFFLHYNLGFANRVKSGVWVSWIHGSSAPSSPISQIILCFFRRDGIELFFRQEPSADGMSTLTSRLTSFHSGK